MNHEEYLASYVAMARLAGQYVRDAALVQQADQVLWDRYAAAYGRIIIEPLPEPLDHSALLNVLAGFNGLDWGPMDTDDPQVMANEIRRFERRMRRSGQWLAAFRRRKDQWHDLFREVNKIDKDKISDRGVHDKRGAEWWLFAAAAGNPRRAWRILDDCLR